MALNKAKGSLAVDRVGAVKELDFAAIAHPELVIEAAYFGEFVGDPFIRRHAVIMTAFDHERARGDQGVNYRRNVWHYPLMPLQAVSDFLVADRDGPGNNLEEYFFDKPYMIAEPKP